MGKPGGKKELRRHLAEVISELVDAELVKGELSRDRERLQDQVNRLQQRANAAMDKQDERWTAAIELVEAGTRLYDVAKGAGAVPTRKHQWLDAVERAREKGVVPKFKATFGAITVTQLDNDGGVNL